MLIERLNSYFTWVDDDNATTNDMPSFMKGSEWLDREDGSSEAWEYVLLRQAKDEIEGLIRAIKVMGNSKDGDAIARNFLLNQGYDKSS